VAHQEYYDDEGTYYPSVTTILNATLPKPALVDWAWKLGKAGKDYKTVRDDAAGIGTKIHDGLEHYIAGTLDYSNVDPAVKAACISLKEVLKPLNVLEDADKPGIRFIDGMVVHSERHFKAKLSVFGDGPFPVSGTTDLLLDTPNKQRMVIDFKTSNQIYESSWIQLAGYDLLADINLTRENPVKTEDVSYYIFHINKKTGVGKLYEKSYVENLRRMFAGLVWQHYQFNTVKRLLA